jgi:hypothetical protein
MTIPGRKSEVVGINDKKIAEKRVKGEKKYNHSPDESQIVDFHPETPYSLLIESPMKNPAPIIFLCTLAACGPLSGDSSYRGPEEFGPVYAEMLVRATDPDTITSPGASPQMGQDSILASAGMTREEFNATVEWYNRDVKRWGDLLQNVVRYLEEKSETREGNDSSKGPGLPAPAEQPSSQ